jgi:hypothetical protein
MPILDILNNGMKSNISVAGSVPIKWDFDESNRIGTVIGSGNVYKDKNFAYATANTEAHLQDMLNSKIYKNTRILVPEDLYKKYIFFEQVDCLPNFPAMKSLDIDDETCSEQLLSLMLACWMEVDNIYLFGYDIQNLTERSRLISIAICYPHSNIIYVRNPNPSKIFLFDTYDNMSVMDYIQFQELVDKHGK